MNDNQFIVRDTDRGNERPCESRSEAEEVADELQSLGADVEIIPPREEDNVDVVEHDEPPKEADTIEPDTPDTEGAETDIDALVQNPIDWLERKNGAYVNTVKGTPAISKRGFRYIQSQFGITTESEVVATFDDPMGVVVWAKAELPDGRSAEAHGEGYVTERKVDDNEFVRYADTRAKNRALADLTSSGALCVEEMEGEL